MYHYFIRKKISWVFQRLGEGDFESLLKDFSVHFEHRFAGNHCLGGERHTVDGMRRWFKRLFSLFPQLKFEIKEIIVNGGPGNTVVSIEWRDYGKRQDGLPYENYGVHFIRLKWGRVVSVHAYLDTQRVEKACCEMAAQGIKEATLPPIED